MRIATVADSWIEWIAVRLGLVPTPMLDTFHAAAVARSIMVATKVGVFESLAHQPKSVSDVAAETEIDPVALGKLLNVLVTAGYLRCKDQRFALMRPAKWLLKQSDPSLHDNMLFRFLEWQALENLEEYVRSGQHLDVHDQIEDGQWAIYQRGMRSIAGVSAPEVAKKMPIPTTATKMLDVGGAHGFYSVAICRLHDNLCATVLDLAPAVEVSAKILAEENMGDRVVHRVGNALTDDFGEGDWDVIFASHLIHHFDEAASQQFVCRAAKALKPDGILAILDAPRVPTGTSDGQTAALLDLFFAMTSNSGCWPTKSIHAWMGHCGLKVCPNIKLLTSPGLAIFVGQR